MMYQLRYNILRILCLMALGLFHPVFGQEITKESQVETIYKIQITASYKKEISIDSLKKKHRIDVPVNVYFHRNYYKYTLYEFHNLAHAIDTMMLVMDKYKLTDAFIVKFDNDIRVDFDSDSAYMSTLSHILEKDKSDIFLIYEVQDTTASQASNDSLSTNIYIDHGVIRPILIKKDSSTNKHTNQLKSVRESLVSKTRDWTDEVLPTKTAQITSYVLTLAHNHFALFMVLVLIVYFTIFSIVIIAVILNSRIWGNHRKKRKQKLKDSYHEIIADYLFKDTDENIVPMRLFNERTKFKKNILIELIIDLYDSLEGDIADKLRALYLNLQLHKVSISKTKSWIWNIKAKGIQELASMNVEGAEQYIKKYLRSNNSELRSEAYLAFVRLNKENPFGFLDLEIKYFTPWEQLNVHAAAKKYNIEIPEFSHWLSSDNLSVITFSLKMIIIYKQQSAKNELATLVKHQNPHIRELAFQAIGELNLTELQDELIKIFDSESYINKLTILQALSKIPDSNQFDFLEKVILKSEDFRITLNAAKDLYHIGTTGKERLKQIKTSLSPDLDAIYLHITDKRI